MAGDRRERGRVTGGAIGRGRRWLRSWRDVVEIERKVWADTSVPTKLAMWRRGFLSTSARRYRFDRDGYDDYLPDIPYLRRVADINGGAGLLLNDKPAFARALRAFPEHAVACPAVVRGGRLCSFDDPDEPLGRLSDLLDAWPHVVVKPAGGFGSDAVAFVSRAAAGFEKDGEPLDAGALDRWCATLEDALVCERVVQHPALAALYPHATNTLRVMTLWDDAPAQPFVAAAMIRIGTERSRPLEAWLRGGIGAGIDLATGALGPAVDSVHGHWHAAHPDTGAAIEGVRIPHWERIAAEIVEIARAFPRLASIGWDLAVTADGFRIIEGNNHATIGMLQVHAPLLRDPRVRRFYARHGIVRPR